ncbi:MAG: HNH endonuclease signature motif containing protein [Gammaproteobacteria bacterium]|nr:HNH endonuclease signature motif containing protein [Gammaproteobacteria bacterium]
MRKFQLWRNYSRQEIAEELGVKSQHALWRGVFTPKGQRSIFLFVTREKQRSQTQYQDNIFGNTLVWEGEKKHRNDQRIVSADQRGDQIILFFRTRHHKRFIYFGQVHLENYELRTEKPSHFVFKIKALEPEDGDIGALLTERASTRRERVGQDKFRKNVLDLWSSSCAVTSLQYPALLRASHIRPWRHCSDEDRLNKYNGLALTPSLDLLFDIGLVSFKETDGSIRLSDGLDVCDWRILNVKSAMSLRMMFPESKEYLRYHNECVFESWKKAKRIVDIFE